MTLTHLFAPIVKAEKQDDGTMLVSGPVSTAALDRDQQICDATWLDAAVPKWFGEGGNVREQHSHIAAGTALSYWKGDNEQHWVEALVVDPTSVLKVDKKVLRGFSIGIKNARVVKDEHAPGGRIIDGDIIEVSLVDRPANPECLLALAKSDDTGHVTEVEQEFVDLTSEHQASVSAGADEVRARAQEVLDHLAALHVPAFDRAKADEGSDIAGAEQAISIIARLIQSEAEGLANGELGERYDIDLLLEAVSALRWFIASEQDEALADAAATVVELAEGTDTGKAVEAEPAEDPVKGDSPTTPATAIDVDGLLTKADGDDLREQVTKALASVDQQVTDAVTKAMEPLLERLAKVEGAPLPGGPVRVRTKQDHHAAVEHDRADLLRKADHYEEQAAKATSADLRDGYAALAADAREKAAR